MQLRRIKGQLANPGLRGKLPVKRSVCVTVCVCMLLVLEVRGK